MIDHTTKAEMLDAAVKFSLGVSGIGIFGILVFAAFLK